MLSTTVFALMLRLFVSLAIVIGLMALLAGALRKRGVTVGNGGGGSRRNRAAVQVDVLARRALGRNAQVAIVRAGSKTLVLGVTEHQVTMLGETAVDMLDDDGLEVMTGEPQGTGFRSPAGGRADSAWRAMLDAVREKTVRR